MKDEESMLTEEEKREIEEEIRQHEHKQSAALEVLKIVQRRRGWVPDEIHDLAGVLGMTPAELDALATFYNLIFKKPVGKHVILVCDSVSCWVMGYEKILEHLTSRIGIGLNGTSSDGLFTLLPVACLGACDHAPAMMIDEMLYTELTPEKIDHILKKYREEKAWKDPSQGI
ncbi:MAG TPA: NADH-quinone oxidoreductase subunit NuoE [Thermodesulfovibrionales bacterium]|nr:NADH-quinone oxidoreductase subunit NuoE [Thermodesulfovibrionales bacterium]